jgi:hypothetical protein
VGEEGGGGVSSNLQIAMLPPQQMAILVVKLLDSQQKPGLDFLDLVLGWLIALLDYNIGTRIQEM